MSALLGRLAARYARRRFVAGDYRVFTLSKRYLRGDALRAFERAYYRRIG